MTKKYIFLLTTALALILAACRSEQAPAPTPTATASAPVAVLSDADKASIDALKGDLVQLAEVLKTSTGPKNAYAQEAFIKALHKTTKDDLELVESLIAQLPNPSQALMETRLQANKLRH